MALHDVQDFLRQRPGCRVAVVCHARPDGDALGSAIGLALALQNAGYQAEPVNAYPLPDNLRFLEDFAPVVRRDDPDWHTGYDCLAVVDCGDVDRLDPANREAARRLPAFTVDHHATSAGIGAAWIERHASSTGEMLVNLCRHMEWQLTAPIASALWTAIITDTGRFCYENATVDALQAATACVAAGAAPAQLAEEIYQSISVAERRLQAAILSRLELHADGKLAIAWVDANDFAAAGVGVEGAQSLINLLRDTAGVEVAILLYAMPDTGAGADRDAPPTVKISTRTRAPHSALDIVRHFGGGGHVRAAGASVALPLPEAKDAVLALALQAFFPGAD